MDWRWIASTVPDFRPERYAVEEYRYDALGRRVWVWSRKNCFNYSAQTNWRPYVECITSLMRRTVWNGDQELVEIQMPGGSSPEEVALYENDVNATALPLLPNCVDRMQYFGRVFYVPGQALDKPLAVTRVNYEDQHYESEGQVFCVGTAAAYRLLAPMTVMPFWNRNGDAALGAYTDGGRVTACVPPNQDFRCVTPLWSFFFSAYNRERGNERADWHGTILETKRDETGLSYSRYRYYDPATGRFTQEDPIGLAGGLNLYGFTDGDPVNFSDPFGLCPERLRDSDGRCPGRLTVREWKQVENAANYHLTSAARNRVLVLLHAGKITGANLRPALGGSTGTLFDPSRVRLNRAALLGSVFDGPPLDLAFLAAHESEHVEQTRGMDPAQRFWRAVKYKLSPSFHDAVEAGANAYACANTRVVTIYQCPN